jgi:hypothetical protein
VKYRKLPVVIDAIRYSGDMDEVWDWVGSAPNGSLFGTPGGVDTSMYVMTLEGRMELRVGDWLIRGVAGEVYPCRHDIFERTYEPVAS